MRITVRTCCPLPGVHADDERASAGVAVGLDAHGAVLDPQPLRGSKGRMDPRPRWRATRESDTAEPTVASLSKPPVFLGRSPSLGMVAAVGTVGAWPVGLFLLMVGLSACIVARGARQ